MLTYPNLVSCNRLILSNSYLGVTCCLQCIFLQERKKIITFASTTEMINYKKVRKR